jgi:hypothetical protein
VTELLLLLAPLARWPFDTQGDSVAFALLQKEASMTTLISHPCAGTDDYLAISAFLLRLYQPDNRDGNWLQPIWEYAYTHPAFDDSAMGRIGIWAEGGQIVGAALYEQGPGEVFRQVDPNYRWLQPAMLTYAEERLASNEARQLRRAIRKICVCS